MSAELEARLVEAIRAGDPGAWGDIALVPTRRVFSAALDRIASGDFDPALARSGFLAAADSGAAALVDVFEKGEPGSDYVALALAASRAPEAVAVMTDLLGDDELGTIAVAGLKRMRPAAFEDVAAKLTGRSIAIRRDAARVFAAWRSDTAWSRAVLAAWRDESSAEVREILEPLVADAKGEVSSRTVEAIRRSMSALEAEEIATHLQQALYTGGGELLPEELRRSPELALVAASDHLRALSEGTRGVLTTWWEIADMFTDVALKWWIAAQMLVDPKIGATEAEWERHFERLTEGAPESTTIVARIFASGPLSDERRERVVRWMATHVTDDDIEIIAGRLLNTDRALRNAARDALIAFGPPGTIAALDYLDAPRAEYRAAAVEVIIAEPCRPARPALQDALESERSERVESLLVEAWFAVEDLFVSPEEPVDSVPWQRAFEDLDRLPGRAVEAIDAPQTLDVDLDPGRPERLGAWLIARLTSQSVRGWDHVAATVVDGLTEREREALRTRLCPDGASSSDDWAAYTWVMLGELHHHLACRAWIEGKDGRSNTLAAARIEALQRLGGLGRWILWSWATEGVFRPHREMAIEAIGRGPDALARLASSLPTLGFDEAGTISWQLGSRRDLSLRWRAGRLEVLNEDDEALKGVPTPRLGDDENEIVRDLAQLSAMREASGWVARTFRDTLERWMLDATILPGATVEGFMAHPIAREIAPRILWGMEQPMEPPKTFRLEFEGGFSDIDERRASPTAGLRPIHPADMRREEVERWMSLFGDYEIVQPFEQLTRRVFRPEAKMAKTNLRGYGSDEIDPARIRWALWGSQWKPGPDTGLWSHYAVREWERWNVSAVVQFDPGFALSGGENDPAQRVRKAWVVNRTNLETDDDIIWDMSVIDAPPLVFSEIIHFLATISNTLD